MSYPIKELEKEFVPPLPIYLKPNGYELEDGTKLLEKDLEDLLTPETVETLKKLLDKNNKTLVVFGGNLHTKSLSVTKKDRESDVDVIIEGPTHLGTPSTSTPRFHTTITEGEKTIDITDKEALIQGKLQGIEELLNILSPESVLAPQLLQLREKISSATLEELVNLTVLLPFEAISLSITKKEDSSLEGTISDPNNFIPAVKKQRDLQNSAGLELGVAYTSLNNESLSYLYLQFLNNTKGNLELNTMESLWALRHLSKMLVATCDKSLEFVRTLEELKASNGDDAESDFNLLYNVVEKVMSEELKLNVTSEDKHIEGKTFLVEQFQNSFSRACASDLLTAVDFITTTFPLSEIISEDLNEIFETWHDVINPNTDFWANFSDTGNNLGELNAYFKRDPANSEEVRHLEKAIMFHQHLIHNIQTYYKNSSYEDKLLQVEDSRERKTENSTSPTYLPSTITANNMSEVIGIVCYTLGLNIEENEDKIENIVSNWKPKGILKNSWLATNKDFDISLDIKNIKSVIEMMEKIDNKIEVTNP